jgi:hypothetical protein
VLSTVSAPAESTTRWFFLVFDNKLEPTHFLATPLGTRVYEYTKIGLQMVSSKDHTDVSATNIIKPTLEALLVDDQQHFDDLRRHYEEEVLR